MTPIVIATDIGADDWRELSAHVARRHSNSQARRLQLVWLGVAALVALAALELIRFAGGRPNPASLIVGTVLTLVCTVGFQNWYWRRTSTSSRAFFGPLRIELDEHGVRMIRAGMTSATDWNRIEQIDETPTAIYLFLDAVAGYPIPKRSVDPTLLPELVAQLRAWHAERTRTSLSDPAPGFEPPSSIAVTRDLTPSEPARRDGFLRALAGNLRAGFKLLTFRRVAATDFTVSYGQLVTL